MHDRYTEHSRYNKLYPLQVGMKVLLDTNIILRDPTILGKGSPKIKLVVPSSVWQEAKFAAPSRQQAEAISQLLSNAATTGSIQFYRSSKPCEIPPSPTLSSTDAELLATAQEMMAGGEEVLLATEDKRLSREAQEFNVETTGYDGLLNLLQPVDAYKDITVQADQFSIAHAKSFRRGALAGTLVGIAGMLAIANIRIIASTITVWGTIALALLAGPAMYAFRGRYRFAYGISELLFGILLAAHVFWPDFNYLALKPIAVLQIPAAMYVMVRGQDNIRIAMRGKRLGSLLDWLSGGTV